MICDTNIHRGAVKIESAVGSMPCNLNQRIGTLRGKRYVRRIREPFEMLARFAHAVLHVNSMIHPRLRILHAGSAILCLALLAMGGAQSIHARGSGGVVRPECESNFIESKDAGSLVGGSCRPVAAETFAQSDLRRTREGSTATPLGEDTKLNAESITEVNTEINTEAAASAVEFAVEYPPETRDLDILFYGGKFSDVTFRRIVFRGETDYLPSYIWVVGLNYKLGPLVGPITIEAEGQVARHTGIQDNWEANVLLIARKEWVWDNAFSFSLALGDGFSLASETPPLEKEENPSANVFMQYLLAEMVFGLPSIAWHPRFLIRVHHRSGAFGVFCRGTCGSNFVTYGFKAAF